MKEDDADAAGTNATAESGPLLALRPEDYPDVSKLITEDGAPVDSIYTERQCRLLADSLYASYAPPDEEPFVALANVGLFSTTEVPPLVPDFLLSLEARFPEDVRDPNYRSYFLWVYGKPPDVVLEVVSDRRGGEETHKLREYARLRVFYYVIYDPNNLLGGGPLRVLELRGRRYRPVAENVLAEIGLGLTFWTGNYQGVAARWLRWCDRDGKLLLTGIEQAEQERQRAEQERQRAEQERQRADEFAERIKRLEAQLRAQGIDPAG